MSRPRLRVGRLGVLLGRMKAILPAALAAFCLSAPAMAQEPVCAMADAVPVPELEPAKQAFLTGEFDDFLTLATPLMKSSRESLEEPIARMKEHFPDGFESCQTILQRRDAGGFVQEISTFDFPGSDFPMSLILQAAPVRGELGIVSFTFNTKIGGVLGELR